MTRIGKIDVHLHLTQQTNLTARDWTAMKSELEAYIRRPNVAAALVITHTYLFSQYDTISREGKRQVNAFYSKLAAAHPKKIKILCGVDIHDPHALDVADDCIRMTGAIGFKVRNFAIHPDSYDGDDSRTKRFADILQRADEKQKMVLAHFSQGLARPNSEQTENRAVGSSVETQYLLKMMQEHPRATLIIAHAGADSFVGLDGLRTLGQYFSSHPKVNRNIYIDLAATLGMLGLEKAACRDLEPVAAAWRAFGLDYILYGSDAVLHHPLVPNWDGAHRLFDECKLFTTPERDKIFYQNAQRLIAKTQ